MPPSETFGRIVVNHSGKALDVAGASTQNGALLVQSHVANGASQLFRFEPMDGAPEVFRIVNKNSGKVVVLGSGTPPPAIQQERRDDVAQGFRARFKGKSFYLVFQGFSFGDTVLDVFGGSQDDGAQVIGYPLKTTNETNQLWKFLPDKAPDHGGGDLGACITCNNRPPGQPRCSGFVGNPVNGATKCGQSFCRHPASKHS